MFPGHYKLYGSKRSYFTQKVENMLRFQRLPFELIEKMPHDGSAIELRTGSGAIPALVTPEDWPLADSTPIARFLNDRFPDRAIIPASPAQRIGTLILEDWFDEWFMRVAMYTRWNFQESVEALVGSGASMRLLNKKWHELTESERAGLKPHVDEALNRIRTFRQRMTGEVASAYGTTLEQGRDIPIWWGQFLDDMAAHLRHHAFLLGDRPSVADFVISGGFEAHFGNDTWPRNFVIQRQPSVLAYAERCFDTVFSDADWLAGDQLPSTWGAFFRAMESMYLPYLAENRRALGEGKDTVSMSFGFDIVTTPVRRYQELSRLDIRDEILNLNGAALAHVKEAIPAAVLDTYLLPPSGGALEIEGNKDTFPNPQGIGSLDT